MTRALSIAVLSLALSACTMNSNGAHFTGMSSGDDTPGSYCYEHTPVCVAGGVLLIGLGAGIIASNHDGGNKQL